jgi:hypothetical protein
VVALLVNQALFTGEYRQAVAFAKAALRAARRRITPALAADLHAMRAKAYARLGDGPAALRCIGRAEWEAQRIRPGCAPDETGYVEPGLVNARVAEALLRTPPRPPAPRRTTGGGSTGWRSSARSSCARGRPTRRRGRPRRWPSGPSG